LLERNELDAAEQHLAASAALGEHAGLPQHPYRSRVAQARLLQARGQADSDDLLELLAEAERRFTSDFSPPIHPVPATIARAHLARGELGPAAAWARTQDPADEPSYLHEYEQLTLLRVLLAQGEAKAAGQLAGRLLAAAEAGGREGAAIEALVLRAMAERARSAHDESIASLDQALRRAEPEGHVRAFLEGGPALTELLRAAEARGTAQEQARRMLAASPATQGRTTPPNQGGLVEPLSARELDVLRLLRSDLSGPDIANEL
ncbi:hypothetical protein B7486_66705, partial [cyanobacterium TDX16]